MMHSFRGASPVAAAVLLVIVAVAAVALLYTWLASFPGRGEGVAAGYTGKLLASLNVDACSVFKFSSGVGVRLYLRNPGDVCVPVDAVYADDVMVSSASVLGGALVAAEPSGAGEVVYLALAPREVESLTAGGRVSIEVRASVREMAVTSLRGVAEWAAYIAELALNPYPHFTLAPENGSVKVYAAVAYLSTSGSWEFLNTSLHVDDVGEPHTYNVTVEYLGGSSFAITWYVDGIQQYSIRLDDVDTASTAWITEPDNPWTWWFRVIGVDSETRIVVVVHAARASVNGRLVAAAGDGERYNELKPMYYVNSTDQLVVGRSSRAITAIPGEVVLVRPHRAAPYDVFIPSSLTDRRGSGILHLKACSRLGVCAETTVTT